MSKGCDVCQNFRPEANLRDRTVTRVIFGEHTVVLCEMHRRIALCSGVEAFEELRELYGESDGQRSYVPRRTGAPESTGVVDVDRRESGRRATDA